MHSTTTIIDQREIPGEPFSAVVRHYSLRALAELQTDVRAAIPTSPPFAVGVSVGLAPAGPRIETIALATRDKVFCLSLPQPPSPTQRKALQELFSNIQYLAGFEFPYTIVLIAHTLGSTVTGYDLSTLALPSRHNDITTPGNFLNSKNPSVSARRINERWDGDVLRSKANPDGTPEPDYALRAWFTAIAANMAFSDLSLGKQLSTEFIDVPMLQSFVDMVSRVTRLELSKPRVYENEFSKVQTESDGSITVQNARYKTRIRNSKQTHLEIRLENGDVVDAMVKGAKGRSSSARTARPLRGDVSHIRVIGREERTNAEQAQYRLLFHSLIAARRIPLLVNIIWFPGNIEGIEHGGETDLSCDHSSQVLKRLNDSQRGIVHAILSTAPRDSLVIAHGPPGTGKTTTIAAAAAIWVSNKLPCWIIAQSNVGVKNIAEKLFKEKVNFKLIVSQDFLFEWHEELYVEIENMVIRSDEIPNSPNAVSRLFEDVTVVLCTLGMLSNPKLNDCGLFRIIPVRSLVIDEASQIDVFEFMHLFYKFSNVLTKVCFFGDPKQLPPYGAQEADLETIFDVKHLKKTAYFLNTQYRLPVPLGEFISKRVYDGKLRSSHGIVDRSCISFIDVWKGGETKEGTSFKNMEEVHMVVRIAKRYQRHGFNFCIITFYDLQRAAIAKAMEVANLPTGRVYNVDSFQGNEADYVILSSVRTERAGFLNSQPRMNVALTRCRKGMAVVTDRRFLQGAGSNTLLGQLCRAWTQHRDAWIDWKDMLSDSVALPGLPASLLSNSSSRAALASTSAPISQWPPVNTANAKIDKQWNPGQYYSGPPTGSWRRGPAQPPMVDSTRADDPFPPMSSTARTGTGAFDETRRLGRLAAASQIPHEKQDSLPKLGPTRQADSAAHRSGDRDALSLSNLRRYEQQQRREAPVSTINSLFNAKSSVSRLNQRYSELEAGVEEAHASWRGTAQGPLYPLPAEASESWRRSIKALQVSTPTPTPTPMPLPVPAPARARARAHAPAQAPAPAQAQAQAPARAPAPAYPLAQAPPPARTPVGPAPTYPLAPAPPPARVRALAYPLAPAPPPARDRASAPTPVHTRVPAPAPAPPPVPTPAPASTPAPTTDTDTAGGFASLLTQPFISALGWIFGSGTRPS